MADVAELSQQRQWSLSHSCFALCTVVPCWVCSLASVVLQTLPAVPQAQGASAPHVFPSASAHVRSSARKHSSLRRDVIRRLQKGSTCYEMFWGSEPKEGTPSWIPHVQLIWENRLKWDRAACFFSPLLDGPFQKIRGPLSKEKLLKIAHCFPFPFLLNIARTAIYISEVWQQHLKACFFAREDWLMGAKVHVSWGGHLGKRREGTCTLSSCHCYYRSYSHHFPIGTWWSCLFSGLYHWLLEWDPSGETCAWTSVS